MQRQEYFRKRLKNDFISYILLQDSRPATELSNELFHIVTIEVNSILNLEKQISQFIDDSFPKLDCEKANTPPDWLTIEHADNLIGQFLNTINDSMEDRDNLNEFLRYNIEQLTWTNGVKNLADAIKLTSQRISETLSHYESLTNEPVDIASLARKKLSDAKEVTMLERIRKNNYEDVMQLYHILKEYISSYCEYNIKLAAAQTLKNYDLTKWADMIKQLSHDAGSASNGIDSCQTLDCEYDRLVPVDFFDRNIESISANEAFMMIMHQLMAKHEEQFIDEGFIINGELRIFTHRNPLSVFDIINL